MKKKVTTIISVKTEKKAKTKISKNSRFEIEEKYIPLCLTNLCVLQVSIFPRTP